MSKKNNNGQKPAKEFVFQKKNYLFLFIGIAFIALGFILMSGGGSDDPEVFNPEIYNFRRIRLAPTLILIGLGIQVYAILLNPHKKKKEQLELIDAIILGIIQGLTEFLPVSSSGHLELGKAILGAQAVPEESLLFTVVLHFATALSTLVVFRKDVFDILKGLFQFKWNEETQFSLKIIISMIPAALVGLFLNDFIEVFFDGAIVIVGIMLVITAFLLYLADLAKTTDKNVSFRSAFAIGMAQAVAILPGISRSGATISAAVLLGVDKTKSARFSFLMVVPLILGKVAKDVMGGDITFHGDQAVAMGAGFVAAFIAGLAACTWMIKLVRQSKLTYFAIYCLIVGLIALAWSIWGQISIFAQNPKFLNTKEDFLNGQILLIDKPLEWTSFQAVNALKWAIRKKFSLKKIKIGHAGTLDPLATGLLIICTGKFTKKIPELQGQVKEYTGTFTLGATTPSYDLETEVNETFPTEHLSDDQIKAATSKFLGEIDQVPPIFSALKKDGKRLYELAREGKEVEIKSRKIEISEFEITRIDLPEVDFRVVCSKGTYIRSLAHDFGKALGSGAYLSELRRTKIGDFNVNNATSPNVFKENLEVNAST